MTTNAYMPTSEDVVEFLTSIRDGKYQLSDILETSRTMFDASRPDELSALVSVTFSDDRDNEMNPFMDNPWVFGEYVGGYNSDMEVPEGCEVLTGPYFDYLWRPDASLTGLTLDRVRRRLVNILIDGYRLFTLRVNIYQDHGLGIVPRWIKVDGYVLQRSVEPPDSPAHEYYIVHDMLSEAIDDIADYDGDTHVGFRHRHLQECRRESLKRSGKS
jgi:hypothetical protein